MKKGSALFRADGNGQIGLGHINRLMALADILKEKFDPTFAIRNPSDAVKNNIADAGFHLRELPEGPTFLDEANDLLNIAGSYNFFILDGYEFTTEYQKILKRSGKYLVCIDDMHATHFFADAVINHAPFADRNAYSCEGYTKLYLGPEYALLREPFLSSRSDFTAEAQLNTLFISFGGADPQNLTRKLVEMTCGMTFSKITVLTGSAYAHLEGLQKLLHPLHNVVHKHNLNAQQLLETLKESDLAIVPSSTILFEVLSAGTIALSGYYVENQRQIYEGFLEGNAMVGLGDFNVISRHKIDQAIDNLRLDPEKVRVLRKNVRKLFDGRTKERIMRVFSNL